MRIYLDNCCYNRPFDDLSQERIHLESEAVLAVLKLSEQSGGTIIGSDVLEFEMARIKDAGKMGKVKSLYKIASVKIPLNETISQRAKEIQSQANIKTLDALHISSAEFSKADVMLTTDDKLEKASRNLNIEVRVLNPIKFFMEVMNYE